MKLKTVLLCTTLICLLTMMGCVRTIKLHNIVVKVQEQVERGEWYVVEEVRHGDIFTATASIVWPESGKAGKHKFRWDLYQDGQCIRHGTEGTVLFRASPAIMCFTVDSSCLKLGNCEMVLYLDGEEYGRITTKIVKGTRKQ